MPPVPATSPERPTVFGTTPEESPQGPPRQAPMESPPNPSPWFSQPAERTSSAHSVLPPAGAISPPPANPDPLGSQSNAVRVETAVKRRRFPVAVTAAAFVLGGAVGAGGFALGQTVDGNDNTAAIVNTAAPSSDVNGGSGTPATTQSQTPLVETTPLAPGAEPAADVARIIGPSVVQVETNRGQGSGVVYADGLILTNHHVIEDAEQVRIRTSDGRVIETEVLGSDPRNDIAVLSAPGSNLPIASIGSSSELEVGQLTVAIGSPFQLQQTVTSGIVSSVNRPVPNNVGGLSSMIQTDAPINPGNSGGALANRAGELVGINASIRTDGTGNSNVGIGFAVPIDTAISVADRIVSGGSLEPGLLGVSGGGEDSDVGVPIGEVTAGSGAEAAGIEVGDRIVSIDGAPVTAISEVVGLVQSHFSGETIEVEVLRGTERIALEATLQ